MSLPVLAEIDQQITTGFLQLVQEKTGLVFAPDTPKFEIRKAICQIEQQMLQAAQAGLVVDTASSYELKHHFADNIYAREIHIPKGHVVVGRIHRFENLNFISKGRVTVVTEEGGVEVLEAGVMMKSPVGVKRLLITHEDTVWTVLHNTKETDLDKIEEEVIVQSFAQLGWEDPLLLENKGV